MPCYASLVRTTGFCSVISQHAKLSDDDAAKFYSDVLKLINIASNIVYAMYAVGGVLLFGAVAWSIVLFVRSKRQV
jgi:thiamine transporter ThiT